MHLMVWSATIFGQIRFEAVQLFDETLVFQHQFVRKQLFVSEYCSFLSTSVHHRASYLFSVVVCCRML